MSAGYKLPVVAFFHISTEERQVEKNFHIFKLGCVMQVKAVEGDDQAERLLAMRSLLLQLLLESFLEPGSVSGSAVDLAICCRKAFPGISAGVTDNLQHDSNEMPPVMDVLVDIILSLLAQSSLPVRAAAEQVSQVLRETPNLSGMIKEP